MTTIESRIRIWQDSADWLDLDYALLGVSYAPSGERILDRRGLLHRIAPPGCRYPVSLRLALLPEELGRLSSPGGNPRSALEWLEESFRFQRELLLYSEQLSSASRYESWGSKAIEAGPATPAGAAIQRRLAFRCYIDELPPELAGGPGYLTPLAPASASGLLELGLSVHEDGSFSSFNLLSGYSPFSPPR
ncbi:hypothetical protein IT575_01165 [bacterium]|nr:hypothetical protein [bacterium]